MVQSPCTTILSDRERFLKEEHRGASLEAWGTGGHESGGKGGFLSTPVPSNTSSAAWCHHILSPLCSLPVKRSPRVVPSLLVPFLSRKRNVNTVPQRGVRRIKDTIGKALSTVSNIQRILK